MSYLNNKVRIEVNNIGTSKTENYMIEAANNANDAIKIGDVLVAEDVNSNTLRWKIMAFYRTDGTHNGKKLSMLDYDYVERNGKTINNKNKKSMKSNKMMSTILDKFKNLYKPEVAENLRISMNGNVCVPVDGEYVSIDANGELVSFPENFTIDMSVYVISRPIDQINVNDIVARGKNYFKVTDIVKNEDGSVKDLKTIAYSGFNHTVKPVKDFMLGQKTIKVVVNLFNGFNGTGIDPMMLALLKDDEGEGNNDFLMTLIAMQAMNPNSGNGLLTSMNPMMLLALNGNGDGGNMFQTMMMMQMMQNMGGGSNMFANFGNMFQPQQTTNNKQTLND